jgi:hypothetical protein
MNTGEGRKGGMLGKALPFFLDSIIEMGVCKLASKIVL